MTDHFEFDKLGRKFAYAIAQSVFTQLPLNSVIRCLVEHPNNQKMVVFTKD